MMWLVSLALRRPLSIAVMALLMLVLGTLSFAHMNVDIFPVINLPVVMMVWNYPGLSQYDMERRIVTISERALSTTVNAIEHLESESIQGIGIVKIYFQPGANLGSSMAQVSAVSESILHQLPRGIEPPQVIYYNAADVPVAQLNVYGDTFSGQQLYDYGFNFLRLQLFTIPGFSSPQPLGGVERNVMVNLNSAAMYANQLSAQDIGNALALTNPVIPSGTIRIGGHTYNVDINMSPQTVPEFNQLPMKVANGTPVLLGQIAPVSDTHQPQENVVRIDARPATYLLVIKQAAASTLAVVDAVKSRNSRYPGGRAQRNEGETRIRSVSLRASGFVGCAPGGGDCGRPGGADGAGIRGFGAQHADRDHVNSVIHSDLDHCAEPFRADDQHDDAWRTCPCRRHAG